MTRRQLRHVALALVLLFAAPATALAYVGPGAGFAFVSSIFIIIFTTFLAVLTLLTWPIRWVVQRIRGNKALAAARTKRVVVLGLDGQDPELTEQFMAEGLLPNFARLKQRGTFVPLQTTLLAESPVAWTSFQTGCNPGKHRIFDFLVPNRKSHLPELSSARVDPPQRSLPLGPFRIPLGKPIIHAGRRSQPFWKILGDHGIFSTVLRVPITFPAEKFNGVLLSAMAVPDLKGSQGTYFYFSSDTTEEGRLSLTGGQRVPLTVADGVGRAAIPGPHNSLRADGGELTLPLEIRPASTGDAELLVDGVSYPLKPREYTPWVTLPFKAGLGITVRGIVRFYLLETTPNLKLYMTPINIDPDKPALPISHPFTYAVYLSKTLGRYATLGIAEDTSALNEGVVDEDAFLGQTYLIHAERERMFFDALDKTARGAVVCVFDITDRLQHMFFRHLDDNHPANRGRDSKHRNAIRKLYMEMDNLVGRTMDRIDDDTVLLVMSDHGFKPFRRSVNLNSWLYRHGFMALKNGGPTGADMFQDVDWSQTKAYAVGFGGIYLNLAGRETDGVVSPGKEAEEVKRAIQDGLRQLYDDKEQTHPVREVYDATEVYSGPYVGEAPDLIVGFQPGHRAGWISVTGGVSDEEIEDNTRPWSGDHNFNPPDVPGMLFCNRPIASSRPSIMDIGPTVLDLFGVAVPDYCDGVSLMPAAAPTATPAGRPEHGGRAGRPRRRGGAVMAERGTTRLLPAVTGMMTAIALAILATAVTHPAAADDDRRVIVLGIDGMDPTMLQTFMDDGHLPNFKRLAAEGDFTSLETSMPPLSPVAWSNFITGMDPGGHGIFDFLHRDPATFVPFNPVAGIAPPGRSITFGSWEFPLSGGGYELLRRGTSFMELLEDAGVPTTVFRMPVNFPPVETGGRAVSGMGTPDMLGTNGTYAFYTDYPPENMNALSQGVGHLVDVINGRVSAQLHGPPNTFRRFPTDDSATRRRTAEIEYENPESVVDFEVFVDADAPSAKFVVQDNEFVLNEGEWSDWIGIDFEMVPYLVSISASARFYLQEVRPDFRLYVTPLQIDSANPALPISTPSNWVTEVTDQVGRFYTQEMPEDTDAYMDHIFTGREFWDQAQFVYRERRRALDYLLETFDEGLLFFYFSSVDQGSHMLHHFGDPDHPGFADDELLNKGMQTLYEEMDEALGRVLEEVEVDERTTLIVMSDHGFSPFYWGVNLNSWLVEKGYVTLKDPSRQDELPLYLNVDWTQTTAYALGLQGLYVNVRGRDKDGIVSPGPEQSAVIDQLEADLVAMVDERNGRSPVRLVYRTADELRGPHLENAPDIIVGYSRGYRTTWDNVLGEFPREIFIDNVEPWSGDHQNDYRLVPGVLLTNRRIALDEPALYDVTVAVLDEFGVPPLPEMIGADALED